MHKNVDSALSFWYHQPLASQGLPSGAAALSKGTHTVTSPQDAPSWPGINPRDQQIPPEVIDEIEVLKQQLRVYADDFAKEREDRERNQAEKEKMREELNAVRDQIQNLEQQVGYGLQFNSSWLLSGILMDKQMHIYIIRRLKCVT